MSLVLNDSLYEHVILIKNVKVVIFAEKMIDLFFVHLRLYKNEIYFVKKKE